MTTDTTIFAELQAVLPLLPKRCSMITTPLREH